MKVRFPIALLILVLGLSLVAFAPLAATLELHHTLGEADEDGHQHSAADLCSWVQSHASSSLFACAVILISQPATPYAQTPYKDRLVQHHFATDVPARGPPSLIS